MEAVSEPAVVVVVPQQAPLVESPLRGDDRLARAEDKAESLQHALKWLETTLSDREREIEILHESMLSLAEQMRLRTVELDMAQGALADAKQELVISKQSLEEAMKQMQKMHTSIKIKDERISMLQERLNKMDKAGPTGVGGSPDRSSVSNSDRDIASRKTSGGPNGNSSGGATGGGGGGGYGSDSESNSIGKRMLKPFANMGVPSKAVQNNRSMEDELARVTEALYAHQTQNALLNEEIVNLRAQMATSASSSVELTPDVTPASQPIAFPLHVDPLPSSVDLHVQPQQQQAPPQKKTGDLSESLREALNDDQQFARMTPDELSPTTPPRTLAQNGLIMLHNTYKIDIQSDRYGFLEDDMFATSAVNNVLMKQLKRHYISAEGANEEHQRLKFDVYLNKRSQSLDKLNKTDELKQLVRTGIPYDYRHKFWFQLSGGAKLKTPGAYKKYLDDHKNRFSLNTQQIELDVLRTLPNNKYFMSSDAPGVAPLRRLLVAYSWRNPLVGYCQGMNMLAAPLLLVMDEEDAFWTFTAIIEQILPPNYYTSNLLVSQADQRVLKELVSEKRPRLVKHLDTHGVDLTLITFNWFLTIFVDCCPPETFFRIWDCFLLEKSKVLFRFAMGILRSNEDAILQLNGSGALFNYLKNMTARLFDVDELIKTSFVELNPFPGSKIILKRERYMAAIRAEQAVLDEQRALYERNVSMRNATDPVPQDDED